MNSTELKSQFSSLCMRLCSV